jgi:prevent-host-death family protein
MSAREAKNGFGRLIDIARAEPVAVEKHGRAVVVVLAVEEYERLAAKKVSASTETLFETAESTERP